MPQSNVDSSFLKRKKINQKKLEQMLLVKGDSKATYPVFKKIKQALKKNEIYKFRIVTNGEDVPVGSEVYNESKK